VAEATRDLDVVMSPTLAHLPPELGHLGAHLHFDIVFPRVEQWVGFTPLANATGQPAISLPLGFDDASHLPIGMMFSGHMGEDGLLLRLALELEAARPFPTLAAVPAT
jgi:amidase